MEPVSTVTHRSVPRKYVLVVWSSKIGKSTNWYSWKSWFVRFGRAVLSMLQRLSCNTFTQWHFWCHHCTPWPWKCGFWCHICYTFDILDHPIMRYCIDIGHLEKWRRVRIAHTADNVITQFRDPHTPMIGFRHADRCWYSAASTLLFCGPPLQH